MHNNYHGTQYITNLPVLTIMKRSLSKEEKQLAGKRQKPEPDDRYNDIDKGEEEQMLEHCEGCKSYFDLLKPIEDWQETAAHCETCDKYWCYKDDCWAEAGSFCADCKEFECNDCEELKIRSCDECLEIYCAECGDFKPGKGGKELCSGCQPWWMKNKPRCSFCKCCGSQRSGAHICVECNDRVCEECEFEDEARLCSECGDFACGECAILLGFKNKKSDDSDDEFQYECGSCAPLSNKSDDSDEEDEERC